MRPIIASWRLSLAGIGSAAWVYWWLDGRHLPAKESTLIWLAAILPLSLAFFCRWPLPRPTRATVWPALVVTAMMLPRLISLEDAPYVVALDEICYSLRGLTHLPSHFWEVLRGRDSDCIGANYLAELAQVWPAYFLRPLYGIRFASALYGLITILATYALAYRIGGRAAAIVAVTVLACSYWHMVMSRTAYPNSQAVMVLCLALLVLVVGTDERNLFLQFVGGILLGTSLMVYDPARVVVPVAGLWLLHRIVLGGVPLREGFTSIAVIGLAAAVFLSPYQHDQGLLSAVDRWRQVSVIEPGSLTQRLQTTGWSPTAVAGVLLDQAKLAGAVYVGPGAWVAPHDHSSQPIIDPISLLLALLGLCLAAVRPRDCKLFLLLAWTGGVFVLGQMFTTLPHYRMGVVIPALAIAAGIAAAALDRVLIRIFGTRGWIPRWGLLGLLTLAIAPLNLQYLRDFHVQRSHAHPNIAIGRFIHTNSTEPVYYVVRPAPTRHDLTLRFLTHGRTTRDVSSLHDTLCEGLDPTRTAVFVLDPHLAGAADVLLRRFPEAVRVEYPGKTAPYSPLALVVPAEALTRGADDCVGGHDGQGLVARYYRGRAWDGDTVRERVEEFPFRWHSEADVSLFGSVEWQGWLRIPQSGAYGILFSTYLAGGRAEIGEHVLEPSEAYSTLRLKAGMYPFRLRCSPAQFTSWCNMTWIPPGQEPQPIPPRLFRITRESEVPRRADTH